VAAVSAATKPDEGRSAAGQGRRWEVFLQSAAGTPQRAVGSVHASDPEHALVMARSVFGRRPRAVALWVVAEEDVMKVTAEELGADPGWARREEGGAERAFEVFVKLSQRRGMTYVEHVGRHTAAGPRGALRAAASLSGATAWVWWILASEAVHASPEGEADAWFGPAEDKTYKHQAAYGAVAPKRRT
jgi:ring-1,2-phenylacetyl-CoA epoxidase subunit PaaB